LAALTLAMVGIALPDSLNPSLIVTSLYLAIGPGRARRTVAFALGAFAVTLAGGIALVLGVGNLLLGIVPKPGPTAKHVLLAIAGMVLTAVGVALWVGRRRIAARSRPSKASRSAGTGSALMLGGGVAGIELVSAFPYFAAIALVAGSSTSLAQKVLLLTVYNLIYALPLFAIAIACAVLGDRADAVLAPIGDWVLGHWPHVVAPLCVAAGCGLAGYGLVQLA
jgi:cytochrome c biogenesis protein CcdA